MAQGTLSSLPEEPNNFILIHHPDPDFAVLPRWFVRDNPVIRPYQNSLLTDPANNTFSVGLKTVDGEKGIEGFQEMCQAHNINGTVRVHYTYIRGSQFNIRIFLDEYTEVEYIVQEEDSDDDYIVQEENIVQEEDSDDDYIVQEENIVQEEEDSNDVEELSWLSYITDSSR